MGKARQILRKVGLSGLAAGLASVAAAVVAPTSAAAATNTVTLHYTGAEQTFVVPPDVTSLQISAVGADGAGVPDGASGGLGAVVTGTVSVTPGQTLYVEVGGDGDIGGPYSYAQGAPGGFNGGGGSPYGYSGWAGPGGGATDIRTVSRTASGSLGSRLIVAGGGGGAGLGGYGFAACAANSPIGGAGGNAGVAGSAAVALSGCDVPGAKPGGGGAPGTSSAGGAGGTAGLTGGSLGAEAGTSGALGSGGSGASKRIAGGGGGGGYYGGGGGGGGSQDSSNPEAGGGGGGGGSSLVPSGGTVAVSAASAVASLSITYLIPTITVTAPSPSKAYGAALPALTPTYAVSPTSSGATPATPAVCTTTATASSPVGTYPVTCSDAADSAHAIEYVAGELTITPAPLTVKAPPSVTSYQGTIPTLPPTYVGLVNSDLAPRTPATCSSGATSASAAGSYAILCSGAVDANYTITYNPGVLQLLPRIATTIAPQAVKRSGLRALSQVVYSAKLTEKAGSRALAGQQLTFTHVGRSCVGTTNSAGVATCTLSGVNTLLSSYRTSFRVSFSGDVSHLPAEASGSTR